jgi:hypothetical protein
MMTPEEQEAARQERLNEPGTEPPCPMCERPRVTRSDYIRCNPCGLNWTNGEQAIDRHPLATQPTASTETEIVSGAQTANSTSDGDGRSVGPNL